MAAQAAAERDIGVKNMQNISKKSFTRSTGKSHHLDHNHSATRKAEATPLEASTSSLRAEVVVEETNTDLSVREVGVEELPRPPLRTEEKGPQSQCGVVATQPSLQVDEDVVPSLIELRLGKNRHVLEAEESKESQTEDVQTNDLPSNCDSFAPEKVGCACVLS